MTRRRLDEKIASFYLRNMPGMNTRVEQLEQDTNYVEVAQNARFSREYGSVEKRVPLRYYNTSAETALPVDGVFRFYTSTGDIKLIMISGSKAYVGTDASGTFTEIRTLAVAGKYAAFKVYRDRLMVSDGYNDIWVYDGSSDNVTWELGACKAKLHADAAGLLDATAAYYYAIGITFGGSEYRCGAVSNTVTTTGTRRKITLSDIPLGMIGTTDRRLYRVEGGGSTLKLVHIFADNTTETWDDTAADGGTISSAADGGGGTVTFTTAAAHGLQAGDRVTIAGTTNYNGSHTVTTSGTSTFTVTITWVSSQSGTWTIGETMGEVTDDMPKGSILTMHRERLFISGDPNNPNAIYFSKPYLPHCVYYNTDVDILEVNKNDNDVIMGLPIHLGIMLCFKKNSICRLHITGPTSGWDPTQWYAEDPHVHTGTPSQWSVTSTPYGIIYLGWDQWYLYSNTPEPLISEFDIENIAPTRRQEVVGFWNKEIFYAAYTDAQTANSYHDRVMVYDVKQKKLAYDTMNVNCFSSYSGDGESGEIVAGSSLNGTVYKAEQGLELYRLYNETDCEAGTSKNVFIGTQDSAPFIEIGSGSTADPIPEDVCIFWDGETTTPGSGWTEVSLEKAIDYTSYGTLTFNNTSPATIVDSDSKFLDNNFKAGQLLSIRGSKSNDGTYPIASVSAGTITLAAGQTLVAETTTKSITAIARKFNSNSPVLITCTAHGLSDGDKITIAGTTAYNGETWVAQVVSADSFYVYAAWASAEATGSWQRVVMLSSAEPMIRFDSTQEPGTLSGTDLHRHLIAGTTASGYGSLSDVGLSTGTGTSFTDAHTHTISHDSNETICMPRSIRMRLFKKNTVTTEYQFPLGAICMWDSATPPSGWIGINSYDGYYARLDKTGLMTISTDTHAHDFHFLTAAHSGNYKIIATDGSSGGAGAVNDHFHVCSGSVSSKSPEWEVDYVKFRFIKRVGTESSWNGLNEYIYALFAAAQATAASNGFIDVTSSYSSRYLKIGSGSIDTGAASGTVHKHNVPSFTTLISNIGWGGGGDQQQAGGNHDHGVAIAETADTTLSSPASMAFRLVRKILGQMQDYNDASTTTYTSGLWISPAIQVNAESFGSWLWNKITVGLDSVEIFSRSAATNAVGNWTAIGTVTHATETFTQAGHGLNDGDRISFNATALPTGISDSIVYHVVGVVGNDFQVSLSAGGSAVTFSSAGTAVTFKKWDGPHVDPNGSRVISTANNWMQYCVAFAASDTQLNNPRLYSVGQYLVKLEYVRASTIAEVSVDFEYSVGFRNFNLPSLDKIFKKLIIVHEINENSFTPGSVDIVWETENATDNFRVDLAANTRRWESYFQSTAMGREINITIIKDDLEDYKIKEIQGIFSNLALII